MRRHGQSGEGRIGALIALAVVGIAIFLGVKIIPVRVAAYEFRDFVEQECRYAAVRKHDDQVRQRIIDKAEELRIPLDPKRLKLERTRSEMIISASFEQPIDLKVYTYVYEYEVSERAPLF
ncbi:MAG: hypothetical protein R3344_12610 [Acidobacteriota bacterium]|nr:hypothetical protein [Acidobacteriota bacterium]